MVIKRKPPAIKPKPAESVPGLVEQVYRHLESMIVTLQLPPGALLSEVVISKELGVSRTPVGEALQRLSRDGLVTILPRRGIVVTEVSASDHLRLLELRREIARFIARVGARRATADERDGFRQVADEFVKAAVAGDDEAAFAADKKFHDLFAASSHNNFAALAMEPLDSLSRRFSYVHQAMEGDKVRSARLHAAIAMAIAKGDAQEAEQAVNKLADYLDEFVRRTLDEPPALPAR